MASTRRTPTTTERRVDLTTQQHATNNHDDESDSDTEDMTDQQLSQWLDSHEANLADWTADIPDARSAYPQVSFTAERLLRVAKGMRRKAAGPDGWSADHLCCLLCKW